MTAAHNPGAAPAKPDNLTWKINWYRQSELEGSLLLGRMVRSVADPELVAALTRHCVEEANHSLFWMQTLSTLRLPVVRIFRSYQSFYLDPANGGGMPSTLSEVLAFTHIFEQRVDHRFRAELADPKTPAPMRDALEMMIRDEQRHLDWVGRWLHTQPDSTALLDHYRRIDRLVFDQLLPYQDRIYDIPGLGETAP